MSASNCHLCGESFSVLRQSVRCDFCKLTTCSSCCRPSSVDRTIKICVKCRIEQKKQEQDDPMDDRPKWLRQSHEARRAAAPPSSSPLKAAATNTQVLSSAIQVDPVTAIESRLTNLRDPLPGRTIANDDDLRARLDRLRDNPSAAAAAPTQDHSVLRPKEHATEEEQVRRLVEQMHELAKIGDVDVDEVAILERRLRRLQEETKQLGLSGLSTTDMPATSMERPMRGSDVNAVLKRLPVKVDDEEEERFCVICPNEPTLICRDCEDDSYCMRCFKECHREWDAFDHSVVNFSGTPFHVRW